MFFKFLKFDLPFYPVPVHVYVLEYGTSWKTRTMHAIMAYRYA